MAVSCMYHFSYKRRAAFLSRNRGTVSQQDLSRSKEEADLSGWRRVLREIVIFNRSVEESV